MTQPKKVVKKTEKREKIEKLIDEVVKPAEKPVSEIERVEAMLAQLRLNDARARLEQAKAANNPDAIIAAMVDLKQLEEEAKG